MLFHLQPGQDYDVSREGGKYKDNTGEHPVLQRGDTVIFVWSVADDIAEDIDEDEKHRDEQGDSGNTRLVMFSSRQHIRGHCLVGNIFLIGWFRVQKYVQ